MKTLLASVTFICMVTACSAQTIKFQKFYSVNDTVNFSNAMTITADGGYAITGYTYGPNYSFAPFVFKTDDHGNVDWVKKFSFPYGGYLTGIKNTSDGNLMIDGFKYANDTLTAGNLFLTKLENGGNILFFKEQSFTGNYSSYGGTSRIKELSDSGVIICNQVYNNFFYTSYVNISKADKNGVVQWSTFVDSSSKMEALDMVLPESKYGITFSIACDDVQSFVCHLDNDGNPIWSKRYKTSLADSTYDTGFSGISLCKTTDNGYGICGVHYNYDSTFNPLYKLFVMKLDSNGIIEWKKEYPDLDAESYSARIVSTYDSGFVIADWTGGFVYMLKITSTGDVVWTRKFNALKHYIAVQSLVQTTDSGFAFAGYSQDTLGHARIFLVKTDKNGIADCKQTNLTVTPVDLIVYPSDSVTQIPASVTEVNVSPELFNGSITVQNACWATSITDAGEAVDAVTLYPNPAGDELTVTPGTVSIRSVEIIDALGKRVMLSEVKNDADEIHLNTYSLAPGMYFLVARLQNNKVVVNRFVKQ